MEKSPWQVFQLPLPVVSQLQLIAASYTGKNKMMISPCQKFLNHKPQIWAEWTASSLWYCISRKKKKIKNVVDVQIVVAAYLYAQCLECSALSLPSLLPALDSSHCSVGSVTGNYPSFEHWHVTTSRGHLICHCACWWNVVVLYISQNCQIKSRQLVLC